jgi:hypothetical protein
MAQPRSRGCAIFLLPGVSCLGVCSSGARQWPATTSHLNNGIAFQHFENFETFRKEFPVKTAASHEHSKTEDLLVSLAETVGSTLGTIAAKVDTAQKAFGKSDITGKLERGGRKLVRQSKKLVSRAVASKKKTRRPRAARRRTVKRAVTRRAKAVVRKAGTTAKRVKARAKATVRRATRTKTRSKR